MDVVQPWWVSLVLDLLPELLAFISVMVPAYWKITKQISKNHTDQKNFTDVSIQKLNGMLTSIIHSFHTPAWVKVAETDKNGEVVFRMLEMNDAYADAFGIKRSEYIGKTDLEAGWPKDIADGFRQNDLLVWASNEPMVFQEEVDGKPMNFRKICVQSPSGKKKGVMGFAIDPEELAK